MYSLAKIFQSLLLGNQRNAIEQMADAEEGRKETTTIRFKPQTRAYLQAQSETLGISVSQLLNIIVEGVVNIETAPQTNQIDTHYDRLMLLFEIHGISPLDISRMLSKFGITLSKLKYRDVILDAMNPDILKEISGWFGVEESWLLGKSEVKYRDTTGWYKNTEGMALYLIELLILHRRVEVIAVKRAGIPLKQAEDIEEQSHRIDVGFLIKYKTTVNDVEFFKYEYAEFQRWNYKKCRDELKVMFKFMSELEKRYTGFHFSGCSLDDSEIEQLVRRKLFPSQIENKLGNGSWYPQELSGEVSYSSEDMNLHKFIIAFTSNPSKHFKPKTGLSGYYESWDVDVFGKANESHNFPYLQKALIDLYDLYHKDK
ncbi:conjugal transfer protein TraE [Kluyvera ascorbata]|nr:conjugal transfer protein TraE [Kluyvera ascorbata]